MTRYDSALAGSRSPFGLAGSITVYAPSLQAQTTTIMADYLSLVRRRWLVLAVGVLGGLALAVLLTLVRGASTSRTATASLLITAPERHGLVPSKRDVGTFASLARSNQVLAPISNELGLAGSMSALRDNVSAAPDPLGGGVIDIEVTRDRGSEPLRIVRGISARLPGVIERVAASAKGRAPRPSITVLNRGSRSEPGPVPALASNLALGLVAGFGLGFAAMVLLELAAPRVGDPHTLSEAFGLGTLGIIPASRALASPPVSVANPSAGEREIVPGRDRQAAAAGEQFRRLRTNVQAISSQDRARSLLVASAVGGEGKTLIACNLAAAFALAGARVMLLDCDLRRPDASARLGLEGQPGLAQVIRGETTVDEAVVERHGFAMLPAGETPPNPSELLASDEMSNLLTRLEARDRLLIVDSPAVLAFADAAVLAGRCGKTMIVVRADRTRTREVEGALMALQAVGAKVAGAVLNRSRTADGNG